MAFPDWFNLKFCEYTPELYRDEVSQTGHQVEALASFLGAPADAPLLDLCCGWGRHAVPLAEKGYKVVGVDGSACFLERVQREPALPAGACLSLVRGDMRRLPLKDISCAAAIQMYTSFGYGTDPADDMRVLRQVHRVLEPGAYYLLDLINWTVARRAFDGNFEQEYPSFDVVERCRIDPKKDLLHIKRALLFRDGRPAHIYEFEIRMFDSDTLCGLLTEAGFRVQDIWGDFDCSQYRPDRSCRMITVARKGDVD
ncbi:MAG: class I SAM-dependent methyltransferase [Gemmatimonadota bacterium]|nr:class I SAM-dependent methyltransferase [Gemmatimonadota bacterium]